MVRAQTNAKDMTAVREHSSLIRSSFLVLNSSEGHMLRLWGTHFALQLWSCYFILMGPLYLFPNPYKTENKIYYSKFCPMD